MCIRDRCEIVLTFSVQILISAPVMAVVRCWMFSVDGSVSSSCCRGCETASTSGESGQGTMIGEDGGDFAHWGLSQGKLCFFFRHFACFFTLSPAAFLGMVVYEFEDVAFWCELSTVLHVFVCLLIGSSFRVSSDSPWHSGIVSLLNSGVSSLRAENRLEVIVGV